MKNFYFFTLLFIIHSVTVNAQAKTKKPRYVYYFVKQTGDTTFCRTLRYDQNAQGSLNELAYVDINGNKVDLKGKSDIPYINTFYMNGKLYDRVELNVDKPGSYYRYAERIADGRIKFYKLVEDIADFSQNAQPGDRTEKIIYWLRTEDGKLERAYKPKNLLKIVMPEMMKCEAFAKKYKEASEVDDYAVKKAIMLYNTSCK
ncbi:MAG: hypothetical protein ACXWDO_03120 [Bacteroidia bacterium]